MCSLVCGVGIRSGFHITRKWWLSCVLFPCQAYTIQSHTLPHPDVTGSKILCLNPFEKTEKMPQSDKLRSHAMDRPLTDAVCDMFQLLAPHCLHDATV